MASYSYNTNSSFGSSFPRLFDPFLHSIGDFNGVQLGGSPLSNSLVLDSERGELVKAPSKLVKKGVSESKAVAALKSHSEAERRRRERINSHLTTLRGLVPCTEKMDKATLLAEVISEVKELKKKAAVASNGILIPMDADEVKVEPFNDEAHGSFSFMATLSCYYRPELLSDLRQALDTLRLKIVKAEISTLGNRLKYVFVFTSCEKDNENRAETCQLLAKSVHQALSSILDKVSFSPEYSTRTMLPLKRRRLSFFDASSSSSGL